ncbi:hypothetical protein PVAND_007673 [Polypedilum vanderplanki]|uniref:Uncharacterized protein n=1 Tax=Polypedilum vanderplanki TaxID=319348 RepID=A0A9J6C7X0_POLVA|nr:hypothetical protein PVAND_007673 [Polypedilum vanderplanki]
MALINNFLCCCELETGGVVISWLGMIGTLIMIVCTGVFLFAGFDNCQKEDSCATFFTIGAITLLFLFCFFLIYRILLSGIRNRKHLRVLPALIVSAIYTFGAVSSLFTAISKGIREGIGGSLVLAVIQIYFFFVLLQLFINFKRGKQRSGYRV